MFSISSLGNTTFHASFDNAIKAERAGDYEGKGIVKNAIRIGLEGTKSRSYQYEAKGELNLAGGAIAFWIKPENWDGKNKSMLNFLTAHGEKSLLQIYRYEDVGKLSGYSGKLMFLYGPSIKDDKGAYQWTIAATPLISEWKKGDWHYVVCTWDTREIKMYIDSKPVETVSLLKLPLTPFTEFSIGNGTTSPHGEITLIDELKIYDRPLTSYEICLEWEKYRSLASIKAIDDKDTFRMQYFYTSLDATRVCLGLHQPHLVFEGQPVSTRIMLMDERNEIVGKTAMESREYNYEASLNILPLKPGRYHITAEQANAVGKKLAEFKEDYRIYPKGKQEWDGNKVGEIKSVPLPWQPITVAKDSVKCWGREYIFGNSLLPVQIVSQDRQLLASPVTMVLTIDGKENVGVNSVSSCVQSKREDQVALTYRGECSGVEIEADYQIEFDGFMWIRLTFNAARPVKIDSLKIAIPFQRQFATLRNLGDYRLERTGLLSDGKFGVNLTEKPIFWLGNERVGLQWFAEGLSGWNIEDYSRTLEINADSKVAVATLNIIDRPITLEGKRQIAFGFQATPVKPQPMGWRKWRFQASSGTSGAYNIHHWFTEWTKYFNYPDCSQTTDRVKEIPVLKKDGKKVCPYVAFSSTTPCSDEYKYFGEHWLLAYPDFSRILTDTPLDPQTQNWSHYLVCLDSESYRDFYIWKLAQLVLGLDFDGLYFDYGVPFMCSNGAHGCGWKDEKGKVFPTYNILGARSLARRIYVLMKEHNPETMLIYHMSGEVVMPVHAFADVLVDGENLTGPSGLEGAYYKCLPLDKFRAEYMYRPWGPIVLLLPQFIRSTDLLNPSNLSFWSTPAAQKPLDHLIGLSLVNDGLLWPFWGINLDKIWKIQGQFGWDHEVEFHPYWESDKLVEITGCSKEVVVSSFTRKNKIMIVPFNDSEKDTTIKLTWPKSVAASVREGVLTDSYHGESFRSTNGSFEIPLRSRQFRMFIVNQK
jgi:hypothetical protein